MTGKKTTQQTQTLTGETEQMKHQTELIRAENKRELLEQVQIAKRIFKKNPCQMTRELLDQTIANYKTYTQ